jgi:hypothetical protein
MRWLLVVALSVPGPLFLPRPGVGDKATVSIDSTVELEITVRDGSGETTRLLNLSRKEEFSQETTAAGADGRPTAVRIRCLSSTLQKSGTDTPLDEKSTALANQVFFATRTPQGWTARDSEGGAPPAEGQSIGAWNDVVRLLPKDGQYTAGATWDVEPKDLLGVLSPASIQEAAGKLQCTCESFADNKASILFKGTLVGKDKNEAVVTLTITTGRLLYDVGRSRPELLSVSGSFVSTLDVIDVIRKPNVDEEERRKVGEITAKSRKLEVVFSFK